MKAYRAVAPQFRHFLVLSPDMATNFEPWAKIQLRGVAFDRCRKQVSVEPHSEVKDNGGPQMEKKKHILSSNYMLTSQYGRGSS